MSECVGAAEVARMSYAEMVGLLDQVNTPPGGSRTIRQWARLARIDGRSYALDLACTTGFSSRALAALTGCRAVGADICSRAVARASARAARAGLDGRLQYLAADAAALTFPAGTFTHVVAGGTFAFFDDKGQALAECHRVLAADGRLCVATFFYRAPPPDELLRAIHDASGLCFCPDYTLDYWAAFLRGAGRFAIEKVIRRNAKSRGAAAMDQHVAWLVAQPHLAAEVSADGRALLAERFGRVLRLFDASRRYQGYAVVVCRKQS